MNLPIQEAGDEGTDLRRTVMSCFSHGAGGAGRDRTDDPRLAKPMLSQLSYSPIVRQRMRPSQGRAGGSGWIRTNDPRLIKTVL